MHILLMIIGVLSAIGVWIWRIQMAAHAAKEIGEFAKGAANLPRKLAFRRKSGKAGSDLVSDPREAAIILMLEIARAGGEVSREQKDVIEELLIENFDFTAEDAEEVMTQAAWVSSPEAGTDKLIRRMVKIVQANVSHEELVELDSMLERVSEAEGQPKPDQLAVLQSYRKMTGVLA